MVVGIDIGATKTWLARFEGKVLVKSRKIGTRKDPDDFLSDLIALIDEFLGEEKKNIEAIGIGAPGPINLREGTFGKLPNLGTWDGFNIRKEMEDLYNIPVEVQNDANAAALGEALFGGGRGCRSVYYITISTGIGGGFVLDGSIINGSNNLTGEIWALPVLNLGKPDILINSSSGPGIIRNVRKLLEDGHTSVLSRIDNLETQDVFKHAKEGDSVAETVVDNAITNMVYAITAVLVVLDPDVTLLGGGLSSKEIYVIDPIRMKLKEEAFFEEHRSARILKAQLWDEAVLYGAISLPGKDRRFFRGTDS